MQLLKPLSAEDLVELNPRFKPTTVMGNNSATILQLLTEYGLSYTDQLWLLIQPSLSGEKFRAKLFELLADKKCKKLNDPFYNQLFASCAVKLHTGEDAEALKEAGKEMMRIALGVAYGYRESDGEEYLPEIVELVNRALEQDFFYDI